MGVPKCAVPFVLIMGCATKAAGNSRGGEGGAASSGSGGSEAGPVEAGGSARFRISVSGPQRFFESRVAQLVSAQIPQLAPRNTVHAV